MRMLTSIKTYLGWRAEVFIWIYVHPAYRDLDFDRRDFNKEASLIDQINTK